MFDSMLISTRTAQRLAIKWTKSVPALVRTPLFSKSTGKGYVVCYIEKNGEYALQCFDPDTGDLIWSTRIPNGGYGAHAVGNKIVAVSSRFTDITGINATTGDISWTIKTEARIRSPVAFHNGNFMISSGAFIYLISEDGIVKRKIHEPGRFFFGIVKYSKGNLISLATYNNNNGNSQMELICLSNYGKLHWKTILSQAQIISSETSGVLLKYNKIYCSSGKFLYCIESNDGKVIWTKKIAHNSGRQLPTINGKKLFIPSIEGCIYCIQARDGKILWKYCGENIITTPVSFLGDLACAFFDGQLHLIDCQTGKLFDQISTGHSPYSALTFWKENAYLGGGDPPYYGKLYCFDCIDRNVQPEYYLKITKKVESNPPRKSQDRT